MRRAAPLLVLLAAGCTAQGRPVGAGAGACPMLPAEHLFNTPIDGLPVHPSSEAFLDTIDATRTRRLHLDLGRTVDPASASYWGIPWNLVHGGTVAWVPVRFTTTTPGYGWDPRAESDCAAGPSQPLVSPCAATQVPAPAFPVPPVPLVEGGIRADQSVDGDHHLLVVDADACRLWELYHVYANALGGYDVFGAASFDLRSTALRPAGWTSADAAGFPILPLLLRADEASAGAIRHALRFTIQSSKIRRAYTWPARHLTSNGTTSAALPPMGQLFRLKAGYPVPAGTGTQARAVVRALQTYGMYLADGGSDLYVSGEPSAAWSDATIAEVQAVDLSWLEAVDLSPITTRPGWSVDSAAVPPP